MKEICCGPMRYRRLDGWVPPVSVGRRPVTEHVYAFSMPPQRPNFNTKETDMTIETILALIRHGLTT